MFQGAEFFRRLRYRLSFLDEAVTKAEGGKAMTRKRVKLEEWIEAARNLYQKDGEIEIDDNAQLSPNDDPHTSRGCYVQAWVWVYNADITELRKSKRRTA